MLPSFTAEAISRRAPARDRSPAIERWQFKLVVMSVTAAAIAAIRLLL